MDNNSDNSSPASPEPSTVPETWSTCDHPVEHHHDFSEDRMQSPQCSEVGEGNEGAYSQHPHHFKVEPQDDCKVVDYSQSHLPQPTSSITYHSSDVKLSPVPSDMLPTSINQSHAVQYEERLEMYERDGDDDTEIPSTTTDHSQDELDEHEVKHYEDHQQPSTSSSGMLQSSDPYGRHQHIEPFSPQQPPTSSTNGYQVGMDNYDGVSPMDSYHNSPAPEISDRMHYRIDDHEDGNLGVGTRSSPNEASIPVSVSSSDIMSSSEMLGESSSANKHIVHVASESQRFPSSLDEVGSISDPNESHQDVLPNHMESHQLVQQELPTMSMHQEGSSLDSTDPTIRYYNPDSFDPNLVRLVNQRFPTLMASGMASVSSPKELYVDSVVRGMINTQSGRLYQELQGDGVLEEVVSARLVDDPDEVKEIVASSLASEVLEVDQSFPIVRMTRTLHVDSTGHASTILDERALASLPSGSRVTTVLTDSLPHRLLTISPGNVPLELVGGNILVGRSIVGHHMPSSSHASHPVCEVTSGIMNSLNCLPNIITTTAVIRERELSSADSLVQVSQISEATPIQSYVSSSTSGLDHDSHIPSHTIILDTTVDSTVGTSEPHLGHTKGLVGSSNGHYAMDMEHQEAVALKYSSDIDVDHYTSVITDHEDNIDSGQGVSTTAEELSQESGVLLISSDDSRLGNSVSASSSSVVAMNVHRALADSIDRRLSSSITSESLMSTTSIPDNQTIATSRPRRSTLKQRGSSKSNDTFDNGLYCDECTTYYDGECPKHRVQSIYDKPVLTRAWASLPASYLSINKVALTQDGIPVYGVFAKKSITKRTQFGPLEGVTVKREESLPLSYGGAIDLVLQIETETGDLVDLDTTDECLSNWMRFVRPAENYREQNLVIVQHGQSLCYTTVRHILPRTELKVGYSPQYATRRGLAIWEPDEEMRAEEEQENSWPCFECSKKFLSSEELQQHLNEHDTVEVNADAIKDQELEDDPSGLRKRGRPKGKALKKGKGRLPSKKFKVALDSLNDVSNEAHSKRSRGRPPKKMGSTGSSNDDEFKCGLCQKVFPRQYSLQRHLAMHSGEKKFKCSVCELKFTHVYNRNRHMRKHRAPSLGEGEVAKKTMKCLFKKKVTNENEWSCTHCNLTFDKSSLFNLHTLTHAAENVGLMEFPEDGVLMDKDEELREPCFENGEVMISAILECPQCTQAFSTKKELIDHASTHGKVVARKSFRGIINPAKPHKCELCYKSFATEDRLLRHMLVHGNEEAKPLKCSICEKRFLNNSALACHVKVHSDAKSSYECPICKEEFDQIVALKEHIKIHSINGLFTCPTCQRTFEEYNQIRKHIRAFHSEKKFPCEHCDKIFPRPDKLKLHMLRHSNHREFLCANCGKQFKRKDKLKEHMKRMHSAEREARLAMKPIKNLSSKKFIPKVSPTDYHRFIYKCHACLLGFKRRGMLVNHLAKRHPDIRPESVPELNLPILKTTRDYYCQYCEKVYKSSSKRKAHILKQHPGAELPMSNRRKGGIPEIPGLPNPTFSQTVGSITTHPHNCEWCHKQYASKAKLLQHQRKKHFHLLPAAQQVPRTHYRDAGPQDEEQYIAVPASLHQQIAEGADMSEIHMEFDEAVVIEDSKSNLVATANIYIEREDGSPTVVVTASDMANQSTSVEALPPADLLTQAMSELTQSLTDYRVTTCTHEYDLTRVTQSCPPSVVVPSPSSSPIPQPNSTPSHVTIEQTQLGRLLGHYDGGEDAPLSASPQPEAISSDASVFVPRTWPSSYTDYPAR